MSVEHIELIGEFVPSLLFYLDTDGRYSWANEAFRSWFGVPPDQLVGLHVRELIGEEAWNIVHPYLDRAYAGETVEYDAQIPYRIGGHRWIHAAYTPHRDKEGHVLGVIVLITNISAQKHTEEALRSSEERYHYLFESVGVAIFEEDWSAVRSLLDRLRASGVEDLRTYLDRHPEVVRHAITLVRIVDVNEYTLQMFDAPSKPALLGALNRIFVPETTDVFKEELIAVWNGRDIYRAQAPVKTLGGQDLSVLFTLVVPKRERDWTRVTVTVTDVTSIHQVETALRESEERLRVAMTAGGMAAWDVDVETGCVTWDVKQYSTYGIPPDKLPRTLEEVYALVVPEDRDHVKNAIVASQNTGAFSQEFRIVDTTGHLRWIRAQGIIIRDHQRRVRRMIGINSDITDRKEAQFRLEHFTEELERQVVTRTEELLHSREQLRALTTKLTLTEQRERQRLASELHDHLQQLLVLCRFKLASAETRVQSIPGCRDLLRDVDDIVRDALAYSRSLVTELYPPVLHERGLMSAIKWLSEWMKNLQLTVSLHLHAEHITLPESHAVLLFQSVRELLINAAKYAGTGHAVVNIDVVRDTLVIDVEDNGAGFDLSGVQNTKSELLSSKFGLLSIRERMTALGGTLSIQSDPGKGTKATLTLPLEGIPPAADRDMIAGQESNAESLR